MKLNVPLYAQEKPWWCWAASAQMVISYVKLTKPAQCDIASSVGGLKCCGNDADDARCKWGDPKTALSHYQVDSTSLVISSALTFAQLTKQLDVAPILFNWPIGSDEQSSTHWMVAAGYDSQSGTDYIWVNNPAPPDANWITFDCFKATATIAYLVKEPV